MKNLLIAKIYLYSFAFLGLVLVVFGLVRILDLGLKVYVFKQADNFASYSVGLPEKMAAPGATFSAQEKDDLKKEQETAQRKNMEGQRQSTASNSLAMVLVGSPLFFYHWKKINN